MQLAVILPTLNRPNFLSKCLKSLSDQTIKPSKIFVINNNKLKNNNRVVCDKFKNDLSIKYYNYFGSINDIRNDIAFRVEDDLLAFLDDDDQWHPDYILKSLKLFNDKSLDVLYTSMTVVDEFEKKISEINLKSNYKLSEVILYNPGFLCSNLIVKSEIFKKLNGFNSKEGSSDKDFFIQVLKNNLKYFINPERLVLRTEHPYQFSKNYKKMLFQKIVYFLNNYKKMGFIQKLLYIKLSFIIFLKFISNLILFK